MKNNLLARAFVALGMQQPMMSLPVDYCFFIFLLQCNAAKACGTLFLESNAIINC